MNSPELLKNPPPKHLKEIKKISKKITKAKNEIQCAETCTEKHFANLLKKIVAKK